MNVLGQGVSVFVVNPAGRILLQHRDEHAPTCPDMWCLPGGAVEAGEQPADAARREVREETGLEVDALRPLFAGHVTETLEVGTGTPYLEHTFAATTVCEDADIRLGEGRAMRFVALDEVVGLELAPSTRHFVEIYRALGVHEEGADGTVASRW